MRESLLKYLCCPECHADLILAPQQTKTIEAEIEWGVLSCEGCSRRYPVTHGIPRFVPPELPDTVKKNVNSFGYEWSWLSSVSDKNEVEFRSYLGDVEPDSFTSRVVLDAGCGMGKFLRLAAQYGAKDVIGIDLADNSVKQAYANTLGLTNVHVVQADIFHLPFKSSFNLIYSIGVLHHLIHPEEGFRKLVGLLAPSGLIFAWVYGFEGNELFIKFLEPFRRITCHLPLWLNKIATFIIASFLWILVWTIYMPLQLLRLRLLPFHDYFVYFSKLGFTFFWGTVFDKAIPTISNYLHREEFVSWFRNAKLQEISVFQRNANSWSGRGIKQ